MTSVFLFNGATDTGTEYLLASLSDPAPAVAGRLFPDPVLWTAGRYNLTCPLLTAALPGRFALLIAKVLTGACVYLSTSLARGPET